MQSYPLNKIGLVITSTESIAKCVSIIRKYNSLSISEIKSAIENRNYVYDCSATNTSGIRKVRKCYDELIKAGISVEIYDELGDLTTRELISNLIGSYREIEKETQADIDAEVSEDDDD